MTGLCGLSMFGYWSLFVARGMPKAGIPIASELVNATLALAAAYGIYRLKKWGYALGLLAAGMWIYGLVGGITMKDGQPLTWSDARAAHFGWVDKWGDAIGDGKLTGSFDVGWWGNCHDAAVAGLVFERP